MIAALIAVSLALAGSVGGLIYFGRDAITKSDRLGDMRATRATLRAKAINDSSALDQAIGEIDETRARLERVISDLKRDHKQELELLDEQLSLCGDDTTRGRAAVAGLRRMLSADMPDADDSETNPDN